MTISEHSISDPLWLQALIDRVVDSISALNLMGPLGFRWMEPTATGNLTGDWMVAVYPTPNEASGGKLDGVLLYPGFELDISLLLKGFTRVDRLEWASPASYNGELDGPNVLVRGNFAGYSVQLQIYSLAPNTEKPTMMIDLKTGHCQEKCLSNKAV